MSRQKFDHVIALIEAAIRHNQAQSWMYEAMALAMQAADRPKEQIERAVMSAVEFVGNTGDLMHLGLYLAELGLDQRALQVFRQVASLDPLRPEPYVAGMRIAQKMHNIEGIQWATLGVLSQGWPASQNEIWKSARRVALATLEKLRAEKRTKDVVQFESSMRGGPRTRLRHQRPLDRRCRRQPVGGGADRVGLLPAQLADELRRRALRRPLRRRGRRQRRLARPQPNLRLPQGIQRDL